MCLFFYLCLFVWGNSILPFPRVWCPFSSLADFIYEQWHVKWISMSSVRGVLLLPLHSFQYPWSCCFWALGISWHCPCSPQIGIQASAFMVWGRRKFSGAQTPENSVASGHPYRQVCESLGKALGGGVIFWHPSAQILLPPRLLIPLPLPLTLGQLWCWEDSLAQQSSRKSRSSQGSTGALTATWITAALGGATCEGYSWCDQDFLINWISAIFGRVELNWHEFYPLLSLPHHPLKNNEAQVTFKTGKKGNLGASIFWNWSLIFLFCEQRMFCMV